MDCWEARLFYDIDDIISLSRLWWSMGIELEKLDLKIPGVFRYFEKSECKLSVDPACMSAWQ